MASSPFINWVDPQEEICSSSENLMPPKTLVLVGYKDFLLFYPMKEREREDEGGCHAPDVQESSCQDMSVFAKGSSRNISFCDEARLSGRIGRVLASTLYARLIFDQIN